MGYVDSDHQNIKVRMIDGVKVPQRLNDGYWELTSLARASRRTPRKYLEENKTEQFIIATCNRLKVTKNRLIEKYKGEREGALEYDETVWVHEVLALHFAAWVSPDIEAQVYIYAVERMKESVSPPVQTGGNSIISPELQEIMITLAQTLNSQMQLQSQQMSSVRQDIESLKNQQSIGTGYISVLGYARKHGFWPMDVSRARALGVQAANICRARDIEMGRVADERWGEVNSYPEDIVREIWPHGMGH
jgi:hypothetical protein